MHLFISKKFIDMIKNPRDIHRINIGIATSNLEQIFGVLQEINLPSYQSPLYAVNPEQNLECI